MSTNDRIILDEILKQRHQEVDPNLKQSEFFELFTSEQILKDQDLSYEEIESGLVGEGQDGGIDGFYLLVNGELVQEDPDYSYLKKNIDVDLVLIQSKMHEGFQETPIERFNSVSDDILDLSKTLTELEDVYHSSLLENIRRFRELQAQLANRFPNLRLSFFYACRGTIPNDTVSRKVSKLEKTVNSYFPNCSFSFEFIGAPNLLELARSTPQTTYTLPLAENPISADGQVGFVCLVKLRDFFDFITDENNAFQRNIFEANVRDYQGRTQVNDDIEQSLKHDNSEDFWWLNNGVTVLASKASQGGKALTVEDPQIVNGLQTSTEIFNYWDSFNTDGDERRILVRVIVPSVPESWDRIIKATNSQTSVQQASLRATDKIHRDIEEYLRPRGLYYDRRKNYYKNEGKPRDRIVGIPHLAQAVMSVVLQRPDTARARPSSLLKTDDTYKQVFNEKYPVQLYYVCAETLKRIETLLKSNNTNLAARNRNNLRFYVLMDTLVRAVEKSNPAMKDYASLDPKSVSDGQILASINRVKELYNDLGGTDQVAKGTEFLKQLKESIQNSE